MSPAAEPPIADAWRRYAARLTGLIVLVCAVASSAMAQTQPAVAGRVVDAFSMRPVAGATVEAGGARAVTDADGRFALALPRGTARLLVAADGYLTDQIDVTIGDATVTVEILLLDRAQFKETVVVTAEADRMATRPPSTIEVSPLEVRSVAGAAENVFHVLQTLPGVSATEDFGSRLAVRGGSPDQNLTIMDGVEIHDPYRLFGLTSAFNPETVENFELTSGGFGPKYGDRLSSLLLIENRAGTGTKRLAGSASLGLTDGNLVVEGKLPGGMAGSWLVTGRRTYYDLVADRITGQNLPSFGDVQAKGVWEMRPGRRLTLVGLRSRESADSQFDNSSTGSSLGFGNNACNDLVSVSWFSSLGARVTSRTIASWYRYSNALRIEGNVRNEAARSNAPGDEAFARSRVAFTREVAIRDVSVRQELGVRAGEAHLVEAGFDVHALDTGWMWRIAGDRNVSEANGSSARGGAGLPPVLDSRQAALRAGGWVLDRVQIARRVSIEPGLRFDWSGLAHEATLAPRVSARIDLGAGFRVRGAAGLFTQSPGYEKLLQSDYFVSLTADRSRGLRSERAVHLLGALEHEFAPGLTARVEAYYKSFDQLIVGRIETPAETSARAALYDFPAEIASSVPRSPQITSMPVNGAQGRAYGIDLYVAHQPSAASERFSGWASYTWGRADRNAYGRRIAFDYDRRHAVSLVGLSRLARWLELGATVRVATGFPRTPVVGLRVAAAAEVDAAGTVTRYVPERDATGQYVWTTDVGGVENLNTGRLPMFARVDLRATFKPSWAKNRWQIYLEVINALNRKNAGSLDAVLECDPAGDRPRLTLEHQGAIPLLPSIGVRFRF